MQRMWLVVLAGLVVSGCMPASASASADQLKRRASFDLGCAANKLRYRRIDGQTQGVSGCGKRATYVKSCDGPLMAAETTCTWLLNGAIRSTNPASAPRIDESPQRGGVGDSAAGDVDDDSTQEN